MSSRQGISSAHLHEFTKRKNWSHRIIKELQDFHYVLNATGHWIYCSPSCLDLTGYKERELVGEKMQEFLHVDDVDQFVGYLKRGVSCGEYQFYFRFRCKDSVYRIFEVSGHPWFQSDSSSPKYFFNQARPYPAKVTARLDTFLQLKLENELLSRYVEEMKGLLLEEEMGVSTMNSEEDIDPRDDSEPSNEEPRNTLDLRGGMGEDSNCSSTHTDDTGTSQIHVNQLSSTPDTAKKRKHKAFDDTERVCTECGIADSPEWRKGPLGPKTLCNACGLRWSKKGKKEAKEALSSKQVS